LTSARDTPELVTNDITEELVRKRLEYYPNPSILPAYFVASPLGLTDKSDESKHEIHHHSYAPNEPGSINGRIPEHYGTIAYSTVSEAISAIQKFGNGCSLLNRDLESAFRHISISPLDTPLLEFEWEEKHYAERYLPFSLRTAPYLFNLFAKTFDWILAKHFKSINMPVEIIHYLDNFLIVLPAQKDTSFYWQIFAQLCSVVGLSIKEAKSKEGSVDSFGGVELDTAKMEICLPERKLQKARNLVQGAINNTSLSLFELQRLTGNP